MSIVVFLGMSLPHAEASTRLKARFLPPVRRGDLPQLPSSVKMVGIIDGVFLSESAVGHREIIDLLKRGVTVVGGGSMGALRAAELQDLGMIGVKSQCLHQVRHGCIWLAIARKQGSEVVVGIGLLRVQRQCPQQMRLGFAVTAHVHEQQAEVVVGIGLLGMQR